MNGVVEVAIVGARTAKSLMLVRLPFCFSVVEGGKWATKS